MPSAGGSAAPAHFPPHELDEALADLAFEITFPRSLVPGRPGRRYARETKRAGGRYKTRKPGQSSRLTPLTKIRFWLMPVPI
jgi:hypothetical protein